MTGITEAELLAIFRAQVGPWGQGDRQSITTFAYDHGYSPVTISHVLLGRHQISDRLANALGFMRDSGGRFIPITNPSDERPDRGGCNGRINGPGRPVSIEGETNG